MIWKDDDDDDDDDGNGNPPPLEMKIKWQHTKKGAASVNTGITKLFKYDPLDEFDTDLPAMNYVGLSRHEFFDAFLCVARLSDSQRPLYLLAHQVVEQRLDVYIYRNMVDLRQYVKGTKIDEQLRDRLHSDSAVIRLFKKYAILQKESQNMEEDAWCAMAEDLYSTANECDPGIWKRGGKVSWEQLIQCFTLCKSTESMDEEWMDLGEFIRCLIYFTAALFRDRPDAKYEVRSFEEKMDLVLKWCHKMDAQTDEGCHDIPKYFHSKSLDVVKYHRMQNSMQSAPAPPLNNILSMRSGQTSTSPL